MKPYSKDLRLRVLAAVDRGVPREEVAKTFSVSVATIKRWLKRRRRETADVEPKPIPGRPRLKGAVLQEWLPSQLQNNNDLTLEEHREAFEEQTGVLVSASTVSRAIERLPLRPWPIKKSHR
jgi:transposase